MQDLLTAAVEDRCTLAFVYDDLVRIVEPHAVGFTSKGKLVLRGFQPDGDTQRGLGWKLFTADKIQNLTTLSPFDGPREGYKMGDKQIATILAQLEVANDDG